MPVGALIDGVVPANVVLKGQVAVPAGSPVRGRIRRLERYSEPEAYYVVAIEYTEVSIQDIRYRFDAELSSIEPMAGVEETLSFMSGGPNNVSAASMLGRTATQEKILVTPLPGVATFFFNGARLNIEGLRTKWSSGRKRPR